MAVDELPDSNLFMICRALRREAIREMPPQFRLRQMRRDELDVWRAMPFDDDATASAYDEFMRDWWERTYAAREDAFFADTLFAVDEDDRPVGTCLLWDAYGRIPTIHWLKVVKAHEGKGIGRALVSAVMRNLPDDRYPVYLHTQPESVAAIKLYADFGFELLSGDRFGTRTNDLRDGLEYLQRQMAHEAFTALRVTTPPPDFVAFMATTRTAEF
jgi:RimJ/RimL family protein N-acetyltransferase